MFTGKILSALRSLAGAAAAVLIAQTAWAADDKLIYSEAMLWKLEKPGHKTSYLYGTMHLPDREIIQMADVLEPYLSKVSVAAFEIREGKFRATFRFRTPFLLDDGRTLEQILEPELYAKVMAIARDLQVHRYAVSMLKPWAARLGGLTPQQRALLKAGRPVLDGHLEILAVKRGLEIKPLEKAGERIFGWDIVPEEDQIKYLKWWVANYERADDRMRRDMDLYIKRDVDTLIKGSMAEFNIMGAESGALIWDEFLVKRNERMLDRAIPIIEEKPTFIAVGIAHLPGTGGMVDLFAKEGFTVTPIDLNAEEAELRKKRIEGTSDEKQDNDSDDD